VANTLANCYRKLITAIKGFVIQALGQASARGRTYKDYYVSVSECYPSVTAVSFDNQLNA